MVLQIAWGVIRQEILANYVVKEAKELILDEKILVLLAYPVIVWEGPTWWAFENLIGPA